MRPVNEMSMSKGASVDPGHREACFGERLRHDQHRPGSIRMRGGWPTLAWIAVAATLLVACTPEGGDSPTNSLKPDEKQIPPTPQRGENRRYDDLPTDRVWRLSGPPGPTSRPIGRATIPPGQTDRGWVVVGLKTPSATRGVWKADVLMSEREREAARTAVLSSPGVRLLWKDPVIPALAVKLARPEVLASLRELPQVDYVEPFASPADLAFGCAGDVVDPETSLKIDPGDVLPWSYAFHQIPDAWLRLQAAGQDPGAHVKVAVIDTGIFSTQTQLRMPQFAEGMSNGRSVTHLSSLISGPFGACDHGTRIAGIVAAPRDGRNVVGVAWKADLITVHTHDSVLVGGIDSIALALGIRMARADGARIFTMAFGSPFYSDFLSDVIRFEYYRTDLPEAIFVAAAGSLVCALGVVWPAKLPEVIAVAGMNKDGVVVSSDSCFGPEVDVSAVVDTGNVETTGKFSDEVRGLGASSGATATITGILALISSAYPEESRERIVDRLFDSGVGIIPNAYQAVGGFMSVRVAGPTVVERRAPYTLTAEPQGDGPYTFLWSTGDTNQSITMRQGRGAYRKPVSVSVTDVIERKTLSASWSLEESLDETDRLVALVPEASPLAPLDTVINLRNVVTLEPDSSATIWSGVLLHGRTGPAGYPWTDKDQKFPLRTDPYRPYSLLYKFVSDSEQHDNVPWEYLGVETISFVAPEAGRLFFRTNDDRPGNGDGAFKLTVTIQRP
jgi:hypothetical protein